MKTIFKYLSLLAFVGLILFSCGSDDDSAPTNAPVITSWEYGAGSTHATNQVAYKSAGLHLEAEINAEAIVQSITVKMSPIQVVPMTGEFAWEYEQVYTDDVYQVINPDFHEHIDIPSNISLGEYEVKLTVEDMVGNSTEVMGSLDILDTINMTHFEITTPIQRGTELNTSFDVWALNNINSVSIAIEGHEITVETGEVEWSFEQSYTEGLQGLMEAEFIKNIMIPADAPEGEYHVEITIEDELGEVLEYESHIDITQ